jgi:hypothetical protein
MQLEGLTIALRTRTPWEATDLGIALVRAHAGRIYAAWAIVTLPFFVLFNLLCWWLGKPWLAALALWWLKPLFDRVPLYVISRAVFGTTPTLAETLRAQLNWGWRGALRWLHWRRLLHPGRAMLLPVDMLEGVSGAQRRERVYVLTRAHASPNVMLTLIGVNLEAMLSVAVVMLGLMFVPSEFFTDSAKAVWQTLIEDPPPWALVLANVFAWFAMSVVEPFYVGAGFGLYLNRRMQLEGWDIELAFRRMATRLAPALAAAALLIAVLFAAPSSAQAQVKPLPCAPAAEASAANAAKKDKGTSSEPPCKAGEHKDATPLDKLFGKHYRDGGDGFAKDVARIYGESDLNPTTKEFVWKRRHPDEDKPETTPRSEMTQGIGAGLGFIAQYGLWIVLVALLVVIALNHRRWLSWMSDRVSGARVSDPLEVRADAVTEQLPDDVPGAVRALLQKKRVRAALALLYRAAVERMVGQLGAPLPPGATESECLRQSRRLRDTRFAALFARIVRSWQGAAYAQRLPQAEEIEGLLAEWSAPSEALS